jgi:hypothetical protein
MRHRDLTETISRRRSRTYLGKALSMQWDLWGQYERDDSEASNPRLRQLAAKARAERYGLRNLV